MKLRLPKLFDKRSPLVQAPLPGFDPIYYLFWYPDVRAAGLDPLRHYLLAGWKEGRDPSAGFSTGGYLAANPDVAAMGHNPLLHFLNAGFAEGRGGYLKDPAAPAPRPNSAAEPMKLLSGPNSKPISETLEGYVDEITHTYVRGWALPLRSSEAPAEIHIFLDDVIVGRINADLPRKDLLEKSIGSGSYGFKFEFDPHRDASSPRTVIVRRAGDGYELGRAVIGAEVDQA
ncbi:hypothetical protein [Methylobacterium mesophilicum]|uniref:hypothetical protein n=1 Tax=Methylobacterium mesophilicum TaxID=39956 RepID=UPI002F35D91F